MLDNNILLVKMTTQGRGEDTFKGIVSDML